MSADPSILVAALWIVAGLSAGAPPEALRIHTAPQRCDTSARRLAGVAVVGTFMVSGPDLVLWVLGAPQ